MNKPTMRSVLAAVLLLAAGGGVWANDYFVAPDGDDANPGTQEQPWRDPVAAARKLQPGDTLHFRAGTYRCRTDRVIGLGPARSGEEGRPIAFRNWNNEHVRLDVSGTQWGVSNNGFSWIEFDGFEIFGSGHNNMKFAKRRGADAYGSHVTVRNCELHSSAGENLFAIHTPHLLIENCRFHSSGRSHGLYLQVGCHNAVIRHCTSENNRGNSGMQFNAAQGGITNALVEGNLLRGNAQGFSLMGVVSSTFRHNVVFNNAFDGPRGAGRRELIMWTYGENPTVCENNIFENNTFVNLVPSGHKLEQLVQSRTGTKNIVFRNNVFAVRGRPVFTLEHFQGFVFENNCLHNIGGGEHVRGQGALPDFAKKQGLKESGTITADPMFEDVQSGDLRLREGSPCIDAGVETASSVPTGGKGRDIGAWEHGSDMRIGARLPWKKAVAE